MTEAVNIREPDRICVDCGKLFLMAHAHLDTDNEVTICPRCSSVNHIEYVKAEHEHIKIEVPDNYEHPLEEKARELFNRVSALTGWREAKVRLWFQLPNPLLGEVSPEWMMLNDKADRLERFISEAEVLRDEYH